MPRETDLSGSFVVATGRSAKADKQRDFYRRTRHAFRCATKCLGIDSITLSPRIDAFSIPTFVREWKNAVNHLALICATRQRVSSKGTHLPGTVCFTKQKIFSQNSWRTLLYWLTRSKGGYRVRALRTVATFLQLKRAFPDVHDSLKDEALEEHQKVLESQTACFDAYDIVDDIINQYFPEGWAQNPGVRRQTDHLSTLKNGGVLGGHTARNLDGTWEGTYPSLQMGSALPMLRKAAENQYDRWYKWACGNNASDVVEVATVPDPFKVRVITRGRVELKTLQVLQKSLVAHLKKFPEFRYAFSEQSPELIRKDLETMVRVKPCGKFLSIDYSAATDAVDGSFAAPLIRRIIQRSGSFELQCLETIAVRECSLGRRLLYPDGQGVQNRGTLMGSLLSFPVLCLWNASIISRSLGVQVCKCELCYLKQRGWLGEFLENNPPRYRILVRKHFRRISQPLFLICGDDAVCRAQHDEALMWKDLSTRIGLVPSPGKTYWSDHLITFCSQYFERRRDTVRTIEFVPVSKMMGECTGVIYNQIPEKFQPFYKRFCTYRRHEWRPLLGPSCLGGLGGIGNFSSRDLRILKNANHQLLKYNKRMPLSVASSPIFGENPGGEMNVYSSWIRSSEAYVESRPRIPKSKRGMDTEKFPWVPCSSKTRDELLRTVVYC
nr:MAG: RNA-dependent RNA polymerase [Narnaviridae sp. 1]